MHPWSGVRLQSFRFVRPRYEARQEEILSWLAETHAGSARTAAGDTASFDSAAFLERMK